MRAWSLIWGWYKEGMVRDMIRKSREAAENTVRENTSRWSGEHDRAGQDNHARSLSCNENCVLAQEDIFWHWGNDCKCTDCCFGSL